MTNKTERYYVVSESELEAALLAAMQYQQSASEDWPDAGEVEADFIRKQEAEAACRARPVQQQLVPVNGDTYRQCWVEAGK